MNKENYKRPVGGGLGVCHHDVFWEAHIPTVGITGEKLGEVKIKARAGVFLVEVHDNLIGNMENGYVNPGLLLDLAIAIVKKAKKDGIDVDRW